MKSALILFLLSQPVSDFDRRMVLATASVESEYRLQVSGDSGRSWGLYQFGISRWTECGANPAEWGHAGHKSQTSAMLRAIDLYRKKMPAGLSTRQQVIWITNCHNLGHGSLEVTQHVAKVLRAFSNLPEPLKSVKPAPVPLTPARSTPDKSPRLTPPAR